MIASVPRLPAQPGLLQLQGWHEWCLGCMEHTLTQPAWYGAVALERGLLTALPGLQNPKNQIQDLESCRRLSLFRWWRGWCCGGEFGSLRLRLP